MRSISLFRSICATGLLCLTIAAPVAAYAASKGDIERRLSTVEERLDAIDGKLERLLNELSGTSAVESGDFRPAAASPGFTNGLTMQLMLLAKTRELDRNDFVADDPGDNVVGSEIVDDPTDFSYSRFLSNPELQGYGASNNQRPGQLWTGYLNVPSSGKITFTAEIAQTRQGLNPSCVAVLELDDREVVRTVAPSLQHGTVASETGSAKLSEGQHKFRLWTFCKMRAGSNYPVPYDSIGFALKMRLPDDGAPHLIPADWFTTKR